MRNNYFHRDRYRTKEESAAAWPAYQAGDKEAIRRLSHTVVALAARAVQRAAKKDAPWLLFPGHIERLDSVIFHAAQYGLVYWKPERGSLSNAVFWSARHAISVDQRQYERRIMESPEDLSDVAHIGCRSVWQTRDLNPLINAQLRIDVGAALSLLSERQRKAVTMRLEGYTLEEVGNVLGVSKERVRQIESKAYGVMRKELEEYANECV